MDILVECVFQRKQALVGESLKQAADGVLAAARDADGLPVFLSCFCIAFCVPASTSSTALLADQPWSAGAAGKAVQGAGPACSNAASHTDACLLSDCTSAVLYFTSPSDTMSPDLALQSSADNAKCRL